MSKPLDFDYKFIRDQGVVSLMPILEHISTETLITAAFTWRWSSVNDEQRALIELELLRRGFHHSIITRATHEAKARDTALREERLREQQAAEEWLRRAQYNYLPGFAWLRKRGWL